MILISVVNRWITSSYDSLKRISGIVSEMGSLL